MRRQLFRHAGLGLFVVLAVLAAPTAGSAVATSSAGDGHSVTSVGARDHHTPDVHLAAPARKVHERRGPHHLGLVLAVLGGAIAMRLGVRRARRARSSFATSSAFASFARFARTARSRLILSVLH